MPMVRADGQQAADRGAFSAGVLWLPGKEDRVRNQSSRHVMITFFEL
jgi:hypothetical protein